MAQGKIWDKESVIGILETFLKLGYSVTKACQYAGIPQSTVATWIAEDEELRLKVNAWMHELDVEARKVIKKSMQEDKSITTATWWAERREKDDFSTRQENINTNVSIEDIMNQFQDPDNLSNESDGETKTTEPVLYTEQVGTESPVPTEPGSTTL